jgi:hypothetical protein
LRESDRGGPVSISYGLPLANWYGGACTITQGGTVVTGNRLAATGAVTIDNGLVTLVGHGFAMASGSPLAYGISYTINATANSAPNYSSASVLANTPDFVAVRYRFTGAATNGSIDYVLMRGSRTLTAAVSYNELAYGDVSALDGSDGFGSLTAPTSSSGAGYTTADNHLKYATGNDSDGNRVGLSYAGEISDPVGIYTSATQQLAHVFGIHAVVGGGTTLTGDDQLFGMDRAWFAMLAQQTSAGVL